MNNTHKYVCLIYHVYIIIMYIHACKRIHTKAKPIHIYMVMSSPARDGVANFNWNFSIACPYLYQLSTWSLVHLLVVPLLCSAVLLKTICWIINEYLVSLDREVNCLPNARNKARANNMTTYRNGYMWQLWDLTILAPKMSFRQVVNSRIVHP